jgi:hypothetical protein
MAATMASVRKGGGAQLRERKGGWTPAKRNQFLAELAQTSNVRASARAVELSEPGAYKLRRRDPAFAAAWGEALCEGYTKLEMLLLQRALAGLDGDVVAASDSGKLAALSERALFSLLTHHRQAVSARAEPVALLYEAGKVWHAGAFPELEDELCGLQAGGGYEGPGRSPDRADALVWAMQALMLGKQAAPSVRTF